MDSLRRDDLRVSEYPTFEAFSSDVQKALLRAASRGKAKLPCDIGENWVLVPSKKGPRQVAFKENRAWRF